MKKGYRAQKQDAFFLYTRSSAVKEQEDRILKSARDAVCPVSEKRAVVHQIHSPSV